MITLASRIPIGGSALLASSLRTAFGSRQVPSVMEPVFEFLKLFIDGSQNTFYGSERWVACGCGIEDQKKSVQISRDQNQLIDVIDLDRNQSHRGLVGRLVMRYVT